MTCESAAAGSTPRTIGTAGLKSHPPFRLAVRGCLALAALALGAAEAPAEIVTLASGRTLSVKSARFDGDQAILTLRSGGEIVCERTLVARVDPDEVPFPESDTAATPVADGESARSAAAPISIPPAYESLVTRLADEHGVDRRLVHAVITVESAYQPRARSHKGARGLMQLMPSTARQYGVRNAYNPVANLDAGIKHLRTLLDRFDLSLALAAYNAGEAAVRRYGGIPPYRETRHYVARVLELAGLPAR
jgi:soluble lytic murein transglycosylase-like protein